MKRPSVILSVMLLASMAAAGGPTRDDIVESLKARRNAIRTLQVSYVVRHPAQSIGARSGSRLYDFFQAISDSDRDIDSRVTVVLSGDSYYLRTTTANRSGRAKVYFTREEVWRQNRYQFRHSAEIPASERAIGTDQADMRLEKLMGFLWVQGDWDTVFPANGTVRRDGQAVVFEWTDDGRRLHAWTFSSDEFLPGEHSIARDGEVIARIHITWEKAKDALGTEVAFPMRVERAEYSKGKLHSQQFFEVDGGSLILNGEVQESQFELIAKPRAIVAGPVADAEASSTMTVVVAATSFPTSPPLRPTKRMESAASPSAPSTIAKPTEGRNSLILKLIVGLIVFGGLVLLGRRWKSSIRRAGAILAFIRRG